MPGAVLGEVPLPEERYPPDQGVFRLLIAAKTHQGGERLDAFGHRPDAFAMADDVAVAIDLIVDAAGVAVAAPAVSPRDDWRARRAIRRQAGDVGIFVYQPVPFVEMTGLDQVALRRVGLPLLVKVLEHLAAVTGSQQFGIDRHYFGRAF